MFFNKRNFHGPLPQENHCGCNNDVVMEPVMTNCIEKEFYHEVPHDI